MERASEVAKALLKEIIIQGVAQALRIKYHLHSVWRHPSSSKVERINHIIKQTLGKLCQETSEKWTQLFP
jgi:hypothetical protein